MIVQREAEKKWGGKRKKRKKQAVDWSEGSLFSLLLLLTDCFGRRHSLVIRKEKTRVQNMEKRGREQYLPRGISDKRLKTASKKQKGSWHRNNRKRAALCVKQQFLIFAYFWLLIFSFFFSILQRDNVTSDTHPLFFLVFLQADRSVKDQISSRRFRVNTEVACSLELELIIDLG